MSINMLGFKLKKNQIISYKLYSNDEFECGKVIGKKNEWLILENIHSKTIKYVSILSIAEFMLLESDKNGNC